MPLFDDDVGDKISCVCFTVFSDTKRRYYYDFAFVWVNNTYFFSPLSLDTLYLLLFRVFITNGQNQHLIWWNFQFHLICFNFSTSSRCFGYYDASKIDVHWFRWTLLTIVLCLSGCFRISTSFWLVVLGKQLR